MENEKTECVNEHENKENENVDKFHEFEVSTWLNYTWKSQVALKPKNSLE